MAAIMNFSPLSQVGYTNGVSGGSGSAFALASDAANSALGPINNGQTVVLSNPTDYNSNNDWENMKNPDQYPANNNGLLLNMKDPDLYPVTSSDSSDPGVDPGNYSDPGNSDDPGNGNSLGNGGAGNIRNYSDTATNNDSTAMPMNGSTADRLAALDKFSQRGQNPNVQTGENSCGQTSITAAMYAAKGGQGLSDLIDSMKDYNTKDNLGCGGDLKGLQDIQGRIKNGGTVTEGDMSKISDALYNEMNSRQASQGVDGDGTTGNTINDFLSQENKVKSTMDQNHENLQFVAMDNGQQGNHWVLNMHDQNAIYDPSPIAGANGEDQVTTDPSVIQRYTDATRVN